MVELEGLKSLMRKRLSEQCRGKNMIGVLALSEIKKYYGIDVVENENSQIIEGYYRNEKLFVKIKKLEIKIDLYKNKNNILSIIENKLKSVGYDVVIRDIILF